MTDQPRIEYVEARRVLLDALTALEPHIGAIVLIGAQAVYLRTAGRLSTYQPFTTDADLAIDPAQLAAVPLLGDAMLNAGFERTSEPGIWQQRFERPGFDGDITVPVDLIVPSELVSKSGRRGARLPGNHGKTAARKSNGVAGAIVDFDAFEITPLESDDDRAVTVNVAGPAALLVAKAHKLGDRLKTPERLMPKDAGDVYRLFDGSLLHRAARESPLLSRRLLGLLTQRPSRLHSPATPRPSSNRQPSGSRIPPFAEHLVTKSTGHPRHDRDQRSRHRTAPSHHRRSSSRHDRHDARSSSGGPRIMAGVRPRRLRIDMLTKRC